MHKPLGCIPEADRMGYWSLVGSSSWFGASGDRAVSVNMADSLWSIGRKPNSSLSCYPLPVFSFFLLFPTIPSCPSNESLSSYKPIPCDAGEGSVNQNILFYFFSLQSRPSAGVCTLLKVSTAHLCAHGQLSVETWVQKPVLRCVQMRRRKCVPGCHVGVCATCVIQTMWLSICVWVCRWMAARKKAAR